MIYLIVVEMDDFLNTAKADLWYIKRETGFLRQNHPEK